MASTQISAVKTQIKAALDALAGASPAVLRGVTITDIKKDPLDMEIQSYPHAFIMPPSIQTVELYDTNNVLRELTFVIMVVQKMDNITSTSEIEDLINTVMDAIDSNLTLQGTAVGGVQPTSSFPEPFIHSGKSLVVFDILIKARILTTLTYT